MSDRTEDPGLYQRILSQQKRLRPPTSRCRASAAVVLWRRTQGDDLEVFWVKRAETLPFMGGWYAFPGGGLSRRDLEIPVEGVPRGLETPSETTDLPESLHVGPEPPPPDLVPGLTACAVRELFEETGVLLVKELLPGGAAGPVASAASLDELRGRLLAHETTFGEILTELGVTPDVSPLVFAGRWMTPPFAPLRFDNRFFLLEWPAGATLQPSLAGRELVEGEWLPPADGYRRWQRFEVLAAPPILHLLKVLAEDGPERGLTRLREPREADMGPFRRIEFRPGVLMVPLATATLPPATHTNTYLVGGRELALIDPGSSDPEELDRLKRALDDLAESHGQRVTAIWLTHHHPDHVGGVRAIREHLGVPVLAHAETARRLEPRGFRIDDELSDRQVLRLAGRDGEPEVTVRVLHTPGHARGHLCFFEEGGRSLLAGDMVAAISTIVIDPPEGDMDDYLASLRRLIELEPRTLFPAHGPAIKNAVEKLRELLDHRLWREEKVLTAWQGGKRTPKEMLPEVYDDAPRVAWPLAERQIEAHLERLRRAGRV
jgi:ribonuclease/clavin/mitogillin